jgi:hypothetical protein
MNILYIGNILLRSHSAAYGVLLLWLHEELLLILGQRLKLLWNTTFWLLLLGNLLFCLYILERNTILGLICFKTVSNWVILVLNVGLDLMLSHIYILRRCWLWLLYFRLSTVWVLDWHKKHFAWWLMMNLLWHCCTLYSLTVHILWLVALFRQMISLIGLLIQ